MACLHFCLYIYVHQHHLCKALPLASSMTINIDMALLRHLLLNWLCNKTTSSCVLIVLIQIKKCGHVGYRQQLEPLAHFFVLFRSTYKFLVAIMFLWFICLTYNHLTTFDMVMIQNLVDTLRITYISNKISHDHTIKCH